MGFSFRLARCVEGRRDKTHTTEINWPPRRAAKTKEKPAGLSRRVLIQRVLSRYALRNPRLINDSCKRLTNMAQCPRHRFSRLAWAFGLRRLK